MTRWNRPLALAALAFALGLTATRAQAQAQEPPPGEAPPEGRPYDGYFATGALAGGVMFIVAKSARRS